MSKVIVLDANGNPMTKEMVLGQARVCDAKAERELKIGMPRLAARTQKTARQWRELALRMALQETLEQGTNV